MKKLLSLALLLGLTVPALAQVNVVPQVGVQSAIITRPTYSASAIGLVPAASATDIFCISAGATKNVSIKKISIAGTAGTAITTPFLIYKRSALDTSGTPATSLALPVAVPLLASDPTSTATLISYTANPTVAGSPLLMDSGLVDLPVTTAAGGLTSVVLQYGTQIAYFARSLDILKGSTQQICVNLNGVSVSSGVLAINMMWTEE